MYGNYLRVTPAELARALADPAWAFEYTNKVWRAEDEVARALTDTEPRPASARRHLGTDKAWHAILFLLDRADLPGPVLFGELPDDEDDDSDPDEYELDWGYGPPACFPPDDVRAAAAALARTSYDDLTANLDPAELTREAIYPNGWDRPEGLDWVRGYYDELPPYFAAAAEAGEAIIFWLD
ncbi:DUF1877 family protein [Micromonospora sonneratiae]|uniref:DUF1877 family protein n=1 Tax=Micromonospora sonneratiae TaxID=1184706 RepID=A0ABW3YCY3_9ACTN